MSGYDEDGFYKVHLLATLACFAHHSIFPFCVHINYLDFDAFSAYTLIIAN